MHRSTSPHAAQTKLKLGVYKLKATRMLEKMFPENKVKKQGTLLFHGLIRRQKPNSESRR